MRSVAGQQATGCAGSMILLAPTTPTGFQLVPNSFPNSVRERTPRNSVSRQWTILKPARLSQTRLGCLENHLLVTRKTEFRGVRSRTEFGNEFRSGVSQRSFAWKFAIRSKLIYVLIANGASQSWWFVSGANLRIAPGSQRLSSSKGQTRRKAATQSHGPSATAVAARLPKGWAGEEPVRPRTSSPSAVAGRLPLIRGFIHEGGLWEGLPCSISFRFTFSEKCHDAQLIAEFARIPLRQPQPGKSN